MVQETDSHKEEKAHHHKRSCWLRYGVPLGLAVVVGIGLSVTLLQRASWIHTPLSHDLVALKHQTTTLEGRLAHLEAAKPVPSFEESFKVFETRLTELHHQLKTLEMQTQTNLKRDGGGISLDSAEAIDKEIRRLAEGQKTLRAIVLFWRLRTQVLSGQPYGEELRDFKATGKGLETVVILDRYADQGLQALKEPDEERPFAASEPGATWWERVKGMAGSFVTIEKVDETEPATPVAISQNRQEIEEVLADMEQTLMRSLSSSSQVLTSLAPATNSGDA